MATMAKWRLAKPRLATRRLATRRLASRRSRRLASTTPNAQKKLGREIQCVWRTSRTRSSSNRKQTRRRTLGRARWWRYPTSSRRNRREWRWSKQHWEQWHNHVWLGPSEWWDEKFPHFAEWRDTVPWRRLLCPRRKRILREGTCRHRWGRRVFRRWRWWCRRRRSSTNRGIRVRASNDFHAGRSTWTHVRGQRSDKRVENLPDLRSQHRWARDGWRVLRGHNRWVSTVAKMLSGRTWRRTHRSSKLTTQKTWQSAWKPRAWEKSCSKIDESGKPWQLSGWVENSSSTEFAKEEWNMLQLAASPSCIHFQVQFSWEKTSYRRPHCQVKRNELPAFEKENKEVQKGNEKKRSKATNICYIYACYICWQLFHSFICKLGCLAAFPEARTAFGDHDMLTIGKGAVVDKEVQIGQLDPIGLWFIWDEWKKHRHCCKICKLCLHKVKNFCSFFVKRLCRH